MAKLKKVYRVHTAIVEKNKDDVQNFSGYNVTAFDAEEAITKTKVNFKLAKGEYVEHVQLLATLDE